MIEAGRAQTKTVGLFGDLNYYSVGENHPWYMNYEFVRQQNKGGARNSCLPWTHPQEETGSLLQLKRWVVGRGFIPGIIAHRESSFAPTPKVRASDLPQIYVHAFISSGVGHEHFCVI